MAVDFRLDYMTQFRSLPELITLSFHFISFDSIKEGCPSTGVVLQGALHLKTLITIYNYQIKKRNYNTKP